MGPALMSKRLNHPSLAGTHNRFGRSRIGGGVTPSNSNARIVMPPAATGSSSVPLRSQGVASSGNLGLNSDRLRALMVERLRRQGIADERVLSAMTAVPRHRFVDQGLASRAYEDAALPIGYGQTISQPWVVARMIAALCADDMPSSVLEIGGGCGYQAAVLGHLVPRVFAVERILGLVEQARENLKSLRLTGRVRMMHGDGMQGLPGQAPFDAIVVAAAGPRIPQALLEQLAVGGRLIAPEGGTEQHLVLIHRTAPSSWQRELLEPVRFVPLRAGIQS